LPKNQPTNDTDNGSPTETTGKKEVLLSQLGGYKNIAVYIDGSLDLVDDLATLLKEEGELLESVIVVDAFREYEVVKKIRYELEKID
jgi:hypothetical protein